MNIYFIYSTFQIYSCRRTYPTILSPFGPAGRRIVLIILATRRTEGRWASCCWANASWYSCTRWNGGRVYLLLGGGWAAGFSGVFYVGMLLLCRNACLFSLPVETSQRRAGTAFIKIPLYSTLYKTGAFAFRAVLAQTTFLLQLQQAGYKILAISPITSRFVNYSGTMIPDMWAWRKFGHEDMNCGQLFLFIYMNLSQHLVGERRSSRSPSRSAGEGGRGRDARDGGG